MLWLLSEGFKTAFPVPEASAKLILPGAARPSAAPMSPFRAMVTGPVGDWMTGGGGGGRWLV